MSILDKTQIGNTVQVNIELSKDRLNKEIIEAINICPLGIISDFRITDGKGIGVILKLSNGKEQWFFENEIDILDENGVAIAMDNRASENSNFIIDIFRNLKYENKKKTSELINPTNFLGWLIFSIKDNF